MRETKRQRQSKEGKNGNYVEIPALFLNVISPYVNFQQAAAEQRNTAGPCRFSRFYILHLCLEASQRSDKPVHFFGE